MVLFGEPSIFYQTLIPFTTLPETNITPDRNFTPKRQPSSSEPDFCQLQPVSFGGFFSTNYVHPKRKKKTIATQTTRVFPTAFSSQRKTAPLFLSHDFFSGDCLASWARQIGEANLKHSAKGTSFERYRGHYMKATQTIYYYEGLIPQNYHRFAACLIPKKKNGVLNNLPETKSGATSQTETSSSNRWFSRAVLVFRERHWDDDGDCYEYHFYLSPAGNMFSVYGANDSCTTMYFDHDCHGDNDNGCARWWQ